MFNIKEKSDIYFIIVCIIVLIAWLYSIFQNKELLIPVFNLFCSIFLAIITYLYLKETEKIREIGSEPEVIIDGYRQDWHRQIILENIWNWVAYDVSIEYIKKPQKFNLNWEVLNYFKTNDKWITRFDIISCNEWDERDKDLIIKIKYKSRYWKIYNEKFEMDLYNLPKKS